MPREKFVDRDFAAGSLTLINQANQIIDEYRRRGFVLTLRQLYYQFVGRALIPNRQSEYKRLGSVINDARLAGLVDWEMIEDRTRELEELPNWDNPESLIDAVAEQFRTDIWADQPMRVEVWIEKEALVGVIEPTCNRLRVPYFACRGYGSQSEMWRAGGRFRRYLNRRQKVLVLHLGDHDPSGIDMTRDNATRLSIFTRYGSGVEVKRIALNMDQVEQYNPPPNPAKVTDSRFESYVDIYGRESWELDALDPTVITDLIENEILAVRDEDAWDRVFSQEERDRRVMRNISLRWNEVVDSFGEDET